MEARKITIVATNVQKKYVLNSTAETLGELKAELREAGISYDNMTFMEGLTRTEMKDDNSLLPTNVKRVNRTTGEETITNELVFMLTNTAKKIKSGSMNRAEAYKAIKDNNLQDACYKKYGRNYTQCSTSSLIDLIEKSLKTAKKTAKITEEPKEAPKKTSATTHSEYSNLKDALALLVKILYNNCVIDPEDIIRIDEALVGTYEALDSNPKSLSSSYSDDEIDEMFKGIK